MLSPGAISSFVKDALAVFKKAGKVELTKSLLDLQQQNNELSAENLRLKELLTFSVSLTFENNAYYSISTDGKKEGPFCSNCWDAERKQMRLHETIDGNYDKCPACKTPVPRPGYKPPGQITFNR